MTIGKLLMLAGLTLCRSCGRYSSPGCPYPLKIHTTARSDSDCLSVHLRSARYFLCCPIPVGKAAEEIHRILPDSHLYTGDSWLFAEAAGHRITDIPRFCLLSSTQTENRRKADTGFTKRINIILSGRAGTKAGEQFEQTLFQLLTRRKSGKFLQVLY